jgi:BMFP domain-containing protein YqiC
LIQMWIHVDEHERLDSLEKRIEQLEAREVTRQ